MMRPPKLSPRGCAPLFSTLIVLPSTTERPKRPTPRAMSRMTQRQQQLRLDIKEVQLSPSKRRPIQFIARPKIYQTDTSKRTPRTTPQPTPQPTTQLSDAAKALVFGVTLGLGYVAEKSYRKHLLSWTMQDLIACLVAIFMLRCTLRMTTMAKMFITALVGAVIGVGISMLQRQRRPPR